MKSLFWYLLAAFTEIAGCFAFWAWLRNNRPIFWLVPGIISLMVFAVALTKVEASNAGRAYAAYGGIYILSSLLWLWIVEGVRPDKWDMIGAALCLLGAGAILLGPRH